MTTPNYALLTTRAECDAATADITFELKTFSVRDAALDLSGDRADRSQTAGAAALAKKDADILSAQNMLARPGITPAEQQDETDALELLVAQRKQLVKRNRTTAGTAPFLADVDAVQIQGQVDILTAVLAGIAAHRATLAS